MPRISRERRLAVAACLLAACSDGTPPEPFAEPIIVEIDRGTTSEEIAEALQARGVIESKWAFLWERFWQRKATILAGEYVFEQPIPAAQALEILISGRVLLYPLTVPEGQNRFETAETVAAAEWATVEEFLAIAADPAPVKDQFPEAGTLEGFLFPETYKLAKTSTAQDLADAMLARFRDAMDEAHQGRLADIADWDALILASMIEEEAASDDERALVSSVFHNRIQRSMLMQCDPTIVYGLILENRYRGRIYLSDLDDPHPYNTYIHAGLPPGPITNPGLASLKAAFAPAESEYLYFVATPGSEGGHAFSKTLREHNRAVRELRRFERSRR